MNVGAIERACGLVRAVAASCRDACPRRDTVYCSSCDLHDARDIAAALDAPRPPAAKRPGPESGRRQAPPHSSEAKALACLADGGWRDNRDIRRATGYDPAVLLRNLERKGLVEADRSRPRHFLYRIAGAARREGA